MKKLWLIVVVVAFIALVIAIAVALHAPSTAAAPSAAVNAAGETSATISINGTTVQVDLATTPAQQELGLGGRDTLSPDTGMLFVFPKDGEYAFWMKDMSFPIDILWLADDGAVIYIVPDLAPSTYPNSYGPRQPARYVLEVPAGFAASHDIKLGDIVTLPGSF